MKVKYDHQVFEVQKYGGISRYFYELVNQFDTLDEVETNITLLLSNNYYISEKNYTRHLDFLSKKQFRGKQRLFNYINKPFAIQQLKKQNFNLFHPTYYDPYFLKYIGNNPFVVTVFDMIHEIFPDMFSNNDKTSKIFRCILRSRFNVLHSNPPRKSLALPSHCYCFAFSWRLWQP